MPGPSLIEILKKTADHFQKKGIPNFLLDAQLLLGHVLKLDRISLYLNYDRPLTKQEIELSRKLVRRRAAREPLQHILGKVCFRKIELNCDRRALIPRPETEILVDHVLSRVSTFKHAVPSPIRILDVGVGTGAIFLSLKKEIPYCEIHGIEISPSASALARENAVINNLSAENLINGDAFTNLEGLGKWHILVSNPPYISEEEYLTLEPEIKWDPHEALISKEYGMAFSLKMIREFREKLENKGFILLEIGHLQGAPLKKEALASGWQMVEVEKDYSGFDRFLILQK